jgi:hypothetical protein
MGAQNAMALGAHPEGHLTLIEFRRWQRYQRCYRKA